MAQERRRGWGRGPEFHSLLAYAGRPLYLFLRRVTIRREGRRKHEPADILLPDGYVAEIMATGFKTPVHCTIDASAHPEAAGSKVSACTAGASMFRAGASVGVSGLGLERFHPRALGSRRLAARRSKGEAK